jgi:hypothetical protein
VAGPGADLVLVYWPGVALRVRGAVAGRRSLAKLGVQPGMTLLVDDAPACRGCCIT